eukprot:1366233-Prorocentrum_lima.AAC.1
MTSSLVGSEMCIRDRWLTGQSVVGKRSTPANRAANSGGGSAFLMPAPVSYTHLTLPTICSV